MGIGSPEIKRAPRGFLFEWAPSRPMRREQRSFCDVGAPVFFLLFLQVGDESVSEDGPDCAGLFATI